MSPKIYILKYMKCAEATITKICKIQFQKDTCVCYDYTENTQHPPSLSLSLFPPPPQPRVFNSLSSSGYAALFIAVSSCLWEAYSPDGQQPENLVKSTTVFIDKIRKKIILNTARILGEV